MLWLNREWLLRRNISQQTSLVASVILCITGSIILIPMVYGIIWYEKYGSNQKCTLINKLVSSLCWSCFEWFIAIQTVDMFRYVFGPLSSTACLTVNNLRFVIYKQQILLMDAINIIRYIYIFWLKKRCSIQWWFLAYSHQHMDCRFFNCHSNFCVLDAWLQLTLLLYLHREESTSGPENTTQECYRATVSNRHFNPSSHLCSCQDSPVQQKTLAQKLPPRDQ